jgi:hypothetical protein
MFHGNSVIPASALDEEEDEDEDEGLGERQDDERTGTRYKVRLPISSHPPPLLTSLQSTPGSTSSSCSDACTSRCCSRTGTSCPCAHLQATAAGTGICSLGGWRWMRVVSSWICLCLYVWSLVAPVVPQPRIPTALHPKLKRFPRRTHPRRAII